MQAIALPEGRSSHLQCGFFLSFFLSVIFLVRIANVLTRMRHLSFSFCFLVYFGYLWRHLLPFLIKLIGNKKCQWWYFGDRVIAPKGKVCLGPGVL